MPGTTEAQKLTSVTEGLQKQKQTSERPRLLTGFDGADSFLCY